MITTVIAIILGIIMTVIIKPGNIDRKDDAPDEDVAEEKPKGVQDGLLDIIRNLFPENIVQAMFQQASSYHTINENGEKSMVIEYGGSQNVLGLIMFFSVFGFFLGKQAQKNVVAKNAIGVLEAFNETIMDMVDKIMWYVPVGLIFLISNKIMEIEDDMGSTWKALGLFICTTLVCLFIHGFLIIPGIYFAVVRKNPYKYMLGISQAIVTAFANASSAATMPITMRNLEVNNGLDSRVTKFMLPLGATINMDGTALYSKELFCKFSLS